MIVPQIIHPRTKMTVPVDEYHRSEIALAYRELKKQIGRYVNFKVTEFKKKHKRINVDTAFLEKLDYWRNNRGLTVITDDTVDPFKSMADGKYYTSKKKYRNEITARGYEEVGNDKQEHRVKDKYWSDKKQDEDIKKDIAEAIYG